MMKVLIFYTVLMLYTVGLAEALFIPEELPTLLSFLYTNIPPIFKGTDSRLGVGFRVGPNADFQLQFELGPQTRTKALGPDAESEEDGSSKKRQVRPDMLGHVPDVGVKKVPGTWLHTWKHSVGSLRQEADRPGPSNSQPVVDYDTVRHLQQLYKEQPEDEEQ